MDGNRMSIHKQCGQEILWVRKDEGWLPPFDMPENLPDIDYQLVWNGQDDAWEARGTNQTVVDSVPLKPHKCPGPKARQDKIAEVYPPIPPQAGQFVLLPEDDLVKPLPQDILRTLEDLRTPSPEMQHERLNRDLIAANRNYDIAVGRLTEAQQQIEKLNAKMNDPERLIGIAKRLAHSCPKCLVAKHEWCEYMAQPGVHTLQLHRER